MPPTAKILALLVVAVYPAAVAAQMDRPPYRPRYRYERKPDFAHLPTSGVVPAAHQQPLSPADRPPASDTSDAATIETPGAVPLPRPQQKRIPLPARSRSGSAGETESTRPGGLGSLVPVTGSLALVVGLFLLVAWFMRRAGPSSLAALPGEVFEVLGRAPLAGRQQVHLLRCGNKLILVSTTDAGAETLAEINDPVEVDRLAGVCRQSQPGSATAAFRQVLQQLAPRNPGSNVERT